MTAHDTRIVVKPDAHQARCSCGWVNEQPTAVDAMWSCWQHAKQHSRYVKESDG